MKSSIQFLIFGFLASILFINTAYTQRDVSKPIGATYLGIQYGINLTGGKLAERYGLINMIGLHGGYKTNHNWIYALDANFMFGNRVRIDGLLQNLKDEAGSITNTSGQPSIVKTYSRGFNVNLSVGKVFPWFGPNPNSGMLFQVGAGYRFSILGIGHHGDEIPQLNSHYKKGYDRLTMGWNTSEFIGYNFMADRGAYNFYAGFYFQQSFMRNQRDVFWDHPNRKVNKDLRIGFLYGIRVGWIVPIYKRQPQDFYFN